MASKKGLEHTVNAQIEASKAEIEAFTERYSRFLERNIRRTFKRIKLGKDDAFSTAAAIGGLERSIRDAGLSDYFSDIEDLYTKELKRIRTAFELGGAEVTLNDVDVQTAETLITFRTDVIQADLTKQIYSLSDAVMSSVFGGEPPDIGDITEKFGSRIAANVATELNTGISAFNRTITARKAEEIGLDLFVYLGPIDKITRPFCRPLVGKVSTKKEIEKLDNGQGLPVLQYGGGYNCRHQWRPVTAERAKEYGYKAE